MIVTKARLMGGPRDGFIDTITTPAPDLVAVAWCKSCRRDHLHRVVYDVAETAEDTILGDDSVPVYLRDPEASSEVLVVYRFQDLDSELDELLRDADVERELAGLRELVAPETAAAAHAWRQLERLGLADRVGHVTLKRR